MLLSQYFKRSQSGNATITASPKPTIHAHLSLGPDDGALELLRGQYLPLSTHRNIHELGHNLQHAFNKEPGRFNITTRIIGHGNHGFVDVGDGAWNDSREGSIKLENEEVWASYIEKLRAPTVDYPRLSAPPIPIYRGIEFVSCSTAGGERGRQLMQRIADIGNLAVYAYTGLIFVARQYWLMEPGSTRGCCIPANAPEASREYYRPERKWAEPSYPFPLTKDQAGKQLLDQLGASYDVVSVSISLPSHNAVELSGQSAVDVVECLFASQPYKKDGEILGAVTARFRIRYAAKPELLVSLIAERVASTSLGNVFFVSPSLKTQLKQVGLEI